ncbi:hypothetical protein [Leptolyngbya sp. PCC 6406]|uniref:hypothetical protein n=1 Tax=Leptolyngbya sp. PCC 6406 TaxID=1173264 RepID=UPI0002AC0E51|nr:hypothetical protein [Leptolyngbya sp. PCC 6406]
MNEFEEFMNDIKGSSNKALPLSETTLSTIQMALTSSVEGILAPLSISAYEQEKFLEEVSNLVQDQTFISEFSGEIDKPRENESEDDFVKRGSEKLRQMLYRKFNVKS